MAPPRSHDFASWLKVVQVIDQRVATAIERYEQTKNLKAHDIACAYNTLSNLLNSGAADYEEVGIAIAYSLTYLPRKICLLAAVLSTVYSELQRCPRNILDIGGGNGAAAVAADLTFDDSNIEVISIEPSQAMQDFVEYIPFGANIVWTPVAGNIDELLDGTIYIPHEYCDLIIMSSCMQPDFLRQNGAWWAGLGNTLLRAASKDALLISVEPYVKGDLTNRLDASL